MFSNEERNAKTAKSYNFEISACYSFDRCVVKLEMIAKIDAGQELPITCL